MPNMNTTIATPGDEAPTAGQTYLVDEKTWAGTNVTVDNSTSANSTSKVKNTTIPWEDPEAMALRYQQWMRLQNLPPWKDVFNVFGWMIYGIITTMAPYTLWQVMGTLAICEAPQTTLRSQEKRSDEYDSASATFEQRSTTSSLRTTTRHLLRQAGLPSLFRGAAVTIIFFVTKVLLHIPLWPIITYNDAHTESPAPDKTLEHANDNDDNALSWIEFLVLYELLTDLLLTTWTTAQTHIILTAPTFKIWYRRRPAFLPTLKATWKPICLYFAAQWLTFTFPGILRSYFVLMHTSKVDYLSATMAAHVAIWLLAQAGRFALLIPAGIVLTRVQASLLPDEEDPIIALDRSFGSGSDVNGNGRGWSSEGILSTSKGAIGVREAWQSVDRREYLRVLWFYGKLLLVEVALRAMFWGWLGKGVWPTGWNPSV